MFDKGIGGRIYELFKPFRGKFLISILFVAMNQAIFAFMPIVIGRLIDALAQKRPLQAVLETVAVLIGFRYLALIINYINFRFEIEKIDYDFPQHIAMFGINKILGFSIGQHHNQNSGIKIGMIGKGENAINNLLNDCFYNLLPSCCSLILILGFMFYTNVSMSLMYLVGIVIYVWMSVKIYLKFSPMLAQEEKMYNEKGRLNGDVVKNVVLVKTNGRSDLIRQQFVDKYLEIRNLSKGIWVNYIWHKSIRAAAFIFTYAAVMFLGINAFYNDQLSAGVLTAYIIWVNNAFGLLSNLDNAQQRVTKHLASIKDYFENVLVEPTVKEKPDAVLLKHVEGEIEFRDVSFGYAPRNDENGPVMEVLKNVSFTIRPGEKVAFVGHSGAGKSTILQMLIRAYDPMNGQVLVDGHDLRDIQLKPYLEQVGIVEQDVHMFDNTLGYNLRFGMRDWDNVPIESMDAVVASCRVNEFFHLLEDGYDTMIGEKGVKLSGGQRQRVGIARALLKDPRILILDEATSSLDSENEGIIRESIEEASAGRTTIIVAHRLSTIQWVDRIFVLSGGEVVDVGNYEELKEGSQVFRTLMKKQMTIV